MSDGLPLQTVREVLAAGQLPRNEAHILLAHVLGVSRTWLIAHDRDPVPADRVQHFLELASRRQAGEPIAYLVGEREFMGHRFKVSPAVLIPRPETELLVETGLECLRDVKAPRMLDLGTGSGAIAVSLALARPDAEVIATDRSCDALQVARENARSLGARVTFLEGDWWAALAPRGGTRFHLIVSNPPYIPANDHHLSEGDLRFEPVEALTESGDGLTAIRAIIRDASRWLLPGGALWLEHGYDQATQVRALLASAGLSRVESRTDLAGIERISGGFLHPL